MATQRQVGSMTDAKPSVSDLTGKEYFLAKETANGFDICGDGQVPVGVISEGKAVGLHTSVNTGNQLKALAGGNIAVNAEVASDASGKCVTAASGDYIFARAKSAAANGELVELEVTKEGIKA